ncbi:MAG: histidinol-phosphatase, partial [Dehalococcoidia bacterium]|nr:histidinol-phosphatase [Dehalococcoidia bacterium]
EGEIIGLFLEQEIPRGLTPKETIERIRDQGGLVTVPHPLDRLRGSRLREAALRRVAQLVDAIEVINARVTFPGDNRRAAEFAEQHGLTITAGSDSHAPHEVGTAYVLLDEPPAHEPAALLAQLQRARASGGLSRPTVHFHSIAARWRKRLGLVP